ncbi:MAG: sigma-54 factor interaction domain-containing protein [Bacillus subtilis]|nr:sigma-54 factor interaction domain-containing protein [Bacillus subtilis]
MHRRGSRRRTPRCCILGESGVGKELFAEQVHLRSSPRATGPSSG